VGRRETKTKLAMSHSVRYATKGVRSIIEVNLQATKPKAEADKGKYVLVKFGPKSWQYKVLEAMEAKRYEVAPTFRPIVDECLLDIGRQLEVPDAINEIASRQATAEAAAKLAEAKAKALGTAAQ
jgi:hypothetical protein